MPSSAVKDLCWIVKSVFVVFSANALGQPIDPTG